MILKFAALLAAATTGFGKAFALTIISASGFGNTGGKKAKLSSSSSAASSSLSNSSSICRWSSSWSASKSNERRSPPPDLGRRPVTMIFSRVDNYRRRIFRSFAICRFAAGDPLTILAGFCDAPVVRFFEPIARFTGARRVVAFLARVPARRLVVFFLRTGDFRRAAGLAIRV